MWSLYMKEVERLLYALNDVAMEFQKDKRKEYYEKVESDITVDIKRKCYE